MQTLGAIAIVWLLAGALRAQAPPNPQPAPPPIQIVFLRVPGEVTRINRGPVRWLAEWDCRVCNSGNIPRVIDKGQIYNAGAPLGVIGKESALGALQFASDNTFGSWSMRILKWLGIGCAGPAAAIGAARKNTTSDVPEVIAAACGLVSLVGAAAEPALRAEIPVLDGTGILDDVGQMEVLPGNRCAYAKVFASKKPTQEHLEVFIP